ncbi:MAG: hypothetical protein MUC88_26470, partial [Planctomycetes bacterium]|nr:hypothetical protein [Planctomycetota bacterium]
MKAKPATQPVFWSLLISCLICAPASSYAGGAGTRTSPYLLSSKQDILELASRVVGLNESFLLTADIDMEGAVFDHTLIAPNAYFEWFFGTFEKTYTGCFNGNGHVIENFSLIGKGVNGFFGGIGAKGRVMLLGLRNVHVDSPNYYGVGMLAGANEGDIIGCYVQGSVAGVGNVGGLVGIHHAGRILDCFSQGTVRGTDDGIGGLAGGLGSGTIERCYAACTLLSDEAAGRGGLVGFDWSSAARGFRPANPPVWDSFWDLDVSGVPISGGGQGLSTGQMQEAATYLAAQWDLAGEQDNGSNDIWMLLDTGGYPVLSAFFGNRPGLLAGEGSWDQHCVISTADDLAAMAYHSYYFSGYYDLAADVDFSGRTWSAPVVSRFRGYLEGRGHKIRGFSQEGSCGFFGRIENRASVANLRLEGCDIKAREGTVGCLVGENQGLIKNCSVTGNVTGGIVTGGLVGYNTGSIWDCWFSGVTTGSQKTGGLAGNNAGLMTNSASGGAVSGDAQVGGLIGSNTGTIRSCYSIAAVAGSAHLGGLVGTNSGSVLDCYARGPVTGGQWIGGLVGQNNMNIARCYSTGAVSGTGSLGGLVGAADAVTGATWNSFWDRDSAGIQTSSGGTGVGHAQMLDVNTFTGAGWDFVGETTNGTGDLWTMPANGYPDLTMT